MEEKIQELEESIEGIEKLDTYLIDSEYIKNNSGKQIDLLKNVDENFKYPLVDREYSFKFSEAIYIDEIQFSPSGENVSLKGFKTTYVSMDGQETEITFSKPSHRITLPKKLITEFKFRAPKNFFKGVTLELASIKIFGYTLEHVEKIESKHREISNLKEKLNTLLESVKTEHDTYKNLIEKTQEEHDNTLEELTRLESEKEEIETNILPAVQEELEEVKKDILLEQTLTKSLKEEKTLLQNNIEQLKVEQKSLNSNVAKLKIELKNLQNDKRVFSTEMVEYIDQANSHMRSYFWLSLIPWSLIAIISYFIFYQTENLIVTLDKIETSKEVLNFFLARLPFVIIVGSILLASYEISKMLMEKMIHIQKQKRQFAKIGIVAKDVADRSIDGMELTAEEKFQLRTKLKMDLLKSHLSADIGKDYEYKIKPSLLEKLLDFINKKEKPHRKNAITDSPDD